MNYDMDIYTFESAETVEPTLRQLQKNDYHSILCDMIANTTAKRLGMNSFLITSGVDSIRKAFDQALLLCQSQQRLRDEKLASRLILTVHDELIVEAPEAEAEQAARILREEMEGCVQYAVPLSTDVHAGKNWLEAH